VRYSTLVVYAPIHPVPSSQ